MPKLKNMSIKLFSQKQFLILKYNFIKIIFFFLNKNKTLWNIFIKIIISIKVLKDESLYSFPIMHYTIYSRINSMRFKKDKIIKWYTLKSIRT